MEKSLCWSGLFSRTRLTIPRPCPICFLRHKSSTQPRPENTLYRLYFLPSCHPNLYQAQAPFEVVAPRPSTPSSSSPRCRSPRSRISTRSRGPQPKQGATEGMQLTYPVRSWLYIYIGLSSKNGRSFSREIFRKRRRTCKGGKKGYRTYGYII